MDNSFCESERNRLNKLNKFQLSHKFKNIALTIVLISFGLMLVRKFTDAPLWMKTVLMNVMLIGMLVMSLSKEKVEDEFIDSLRSQSYRLAFIMSVLYALIQPIANYIVDIVLNEQAELLYDFNYFQILFFMLFVQLLSFWQLKRMHR